MEPQKVSKQDGKAFSMIRIRLVGPSNLLDGYALEFFENQKISATGLLSVFEISSRAPGDVKFIGRWDEKETTLDIDVKNAPENERQKFYSGKLGFAGHHTNYVNGKLGGLHKAEIHWRGNVVFSGIFEIGMERRLLLQDTVSMEDELKP